MARVQSGLRCRLRGGGAWHLPAGCIARSVAVAVGSPGCMAVAVHCGLHHWGDPTGPGLLSGLHWGQRNVLLSLLFGVSAVCWCNFEVSSSATKLVETWMACEDMKGSVRVFCRFRPLTKREEDLGDSLVLHKAHGRAKKMVKQCETCMQRPRVMACAGRCLQCRAAPSERRETLRLRCGRGLRDVLDVKC